MHYTEDEAALAHEAIAQVAPERGLFAELFAPPVKSDHVWYWIPDIHMQYKYHANNVNE